MKLWGWADDLFDAWGELEGNAGGNYVLTLPAIEYGSLGRMGSEKA